MSVVRLIMGVEAMVNDETKRKLRELNLGEIISALELQQADVNTVTLSFDERLQRIVDYLYQEKYNNKIQRLIKLSKFRIPKAEVNEIYYQKRGIDRNTIQELSTCQFIHSNTDIIFQGFTGSGKTYLACATGKQTCKQQVRTHYIRLPDLLVEHDEAVMTQRSHHKLLKKYSSYKLLIIDEWLLNDISEDEQHSCSNWLRDTTILHLPFSVPSTGMQTCMQGLAAASMQMQSLTVSYTMLYGWRPVI